MHTVAKTQVTSPVVSLGGLGRTIMIAGFVVGVLGLVGAFALKSDNGEFYRSYLQNAIFFLTISIGSLFFVLISHLTRAGWSTTVRRIAEIVAMGTFPMLILFLPILIQVITNPSESIYPWLSDPDSVHNKDKLTYYLNSYFFFGRAIAYFCIWGLLARIFLHRSLKQDQTGDKQISLGSQAISAPGMVAFAITIIFSSFDWEMSLEPNWFSTIFPVNFFAGCMLSCLCMLQIVVFLLQKSGRLTEDVNTEHRHDLAKLTFGFIMFWSYTAFSQYMLIWYANIPEETYWFGHRQENGWQWLSLALILGHFVIPFLACMARTVRRIQAYMAVAALLILAIHWGDHYWIIKPTAENSFAFAPVDFLCLMGVGGIYIAFIMFIAGDRPLICLKDPRLPESFNYHNP